jgi:hypothetical protein
MAQLAIAGRVALVLADLLIGGLQALRVDTSQDQAAAVWE